MIKNNKKVSKGFVVLALTLSASTTFLISSCKPSSDSVPEGDFYSDIYCRKEAKKNKNLINIKFLYSYDFYSNKLLTELTSEFNKKHVNDKDNPICVSLNNRNSQAEVEQLVLSSINTGTIPDLIGTTPKEVFSFSTQNIVVNLEKFNDMTFKEDYLDNIFTPFVDESYSYVTDNLSAKNYLESKKGYFYSIPFAKEIPLMYYNKTFFDIFSSGSIENTFIANDISTKNAKYSNLLNDLTKELSLTYENKVYRGTSFGSGLSSSDGSIIKLLNPNSIDLKDMSTYFSFEDLEVNGLITQSISKEYHDIFNGKKLNENGINSVIKNLNQINGNALISYDYYNNLFKNLSFTNNKYTSVSLENNNYSRKLLFNDNSVIQNSDKLRNLFKKNILLTPMDIVEKPVEKIYSSSEFFNNQNLFMVISSSKDYQYFGDSPFQVGVTVSPVFGNKDEPINQFVLGNNISMLSMKPDVSLFSTNEKDLTYIRKQKASFEFVKYILSNETSSYIVEHSNFLPLRKDVTSNKNYISYMDSLVGSEVSLLKKRTIETSIDLLNTSLFSYPVSYIGIKSIDTDMENFYKQVLYSKDNLIYLVSDFYDRLVKYIK